MNTALTFLQNNRDRLGLERYGVPARLSCVVVTPRFRASSHVVFLLVPVGSPEPVLVAKMPRLAGASARLEREAINLQAIQATRPGGFDSIPRVITFEEYHGHPILLETALVGRPMDRATVRRSLAGCCDAVTHWLAEVQPPGRTSAATDPHWFERLVEQPLRYFADHFPLSTDEAQLLKRTWDLVMPLRDMNLPLVFEHSDLAAPNLMLLKNGAPGVVDWELAEPRGLPATDLFFFLTYAAFALHATRTVNDYAAAFHRAFFGPSAWAHPHVRDYAERLQLPPQALTPLFVLCWARYTTSLLLRLGAVDRSGERFSADTAEWLRANRYYALWRHAVTHVGELDWLGPTVGEDRQRVEVEGLS